MIFPQVTYTQAGEPESRTRGMGAGARPGWRRGPEPAAGSHFPGLARGEIAVRWLHQAPEGSSIFYASIPTASRRSQPEKAFLVSRLCASFFRQPSGRLPQTVNLVTDPLGKPRLRVEEAPGPAISFSQGANRTWAALGDDRWELGIDVAHAAEFAGGYPYARVFHPAEFLKVSRIIGGKAAEAAALLWSVKEAAVKALGCGFHFFGPRGVRVEPMVAGDDGHLWAAFWATAPAAISIPVAARRQGDAWLAAALVPREALPELIRWAPTRGRRL